MQLETISCGISLGDGHSDILIWQRITILLCLSLESLGCERVREPTK